MSTADDPTAEQIRYNPNGTVTLLMQSGQLTLPRPGFGQIRALVKVQGRVADQIQTIAIRAQALGREITDEEMAHQNTTRDGGARPDDLERLSGLRDRARAAAEQAEDDTETVLVEWWETVFQTLVPNGSRPEQDAWPSFFSDPTLPQRLVNHWRFVPTGPG